MSFAPKNSSPKLPDASSPSASHPLPAAAPSTPGLLTATLPSAPSPTPQALSSSPKPASSDASLRRPTNYLIGAYDTQLLQAASTAMQSAEREASLLADAHLATVLAVGVAASTAIADSAAATQTTTAALATLEQQTRALKLGFADGAGCCGCVQVAGRHHALAAEVHLTPHSHSPPSQRL